MCHSAPVRSEGNSLKLALDSALLERQALLLWLLCCLLQPNCSSSLPVSSQFSRPPLPSPGRSALGLYTLVLLNPAGPIPQAAVGSH